jgi:hypothetical protein
MFAMILALLGVASILQIVVPRFRQNLAIRNLEMLGAKVRTRAAAASVWTGARDTVVDVNCDGTDVSDDDLANVAVFSELESLSLSATSVADKGMSRLQSLANLKWLYLDRTWVSDAGLSRLKNLRSLEFLELTDTDITDDGLKHLAGMPKLRVLRLRNNARVDGSGLTHLRNVPSLQVLNLLGTVLDEEAFSHLAELSQLQSVYVDEPDTEGVLKGIRALYRDRPNLSIRHAVPYSYCALCIPDY